MTAGASLFVCLFTPAGFAGGKDLWQKSEAGKTRLGPAEEVLAERLQGLAGM